MRSVVMLGLCVGFLALAVPAVVVADDCPPTCQCVPECSCEPECRCAAKQVESCCDKAARGKIESDTGLSFVHDFDRTMTVRGPAEKLVTFLHAYQDSLWPDWRTSDSPGAGAVRAGMEAHEAAAKSGAIQVDVGVELTRKAFMYAIAAVSVKPVPPALAVVVEEEYLLVKMVRATPEERDGKPGYLIGGSGLGPGWKWVPAAVFEQQHFRIGKEITEDTVDRFIAGVTHQQLGNRTMATTAHTVIGFDTTKVANAAQTYAFDDAEAAKVSDARVRAAVWELLGFAHQWAECGIQPKD